MAASPQSPIDVCPDDNWRLFKGRWWGEAEVRRLLEERGVRVHPSARLDGVRKTWEKFTRGDVITTGMTKGELEKVLVERGIATAREAVAMSVADAKREIREADENRVVDYRRMMDLADELKVAIFGHYFRDLDMSVTAPSQPPLLRVNRELRELVLPEYFGTCTFKLQAERLFYPHRVMWSRRSAAWIAAIKPCQLRMINNLVLGTGARKSVDGARRGPKVFVWDDFHLAITLGARTDGSGDRVALVDDRGRVAAVDRVPRFLADMAHALEAVLGEVMAARNVLSTGLIRCPLESADDLWALLRGLERGWLSGLRSG